MHPQGSPLLRRVCLLFQINHTGKIGGNGRGCTCTGHVLNVLPLLLGYAPEMEPKEEFASSSAAYQAAVSRFTLFRHGGRPECCPQLSDLMRVRRLLNRLPRNGGGRGSCSPTNRPIKSRVPVCCGLTSKVAAVEGIAPPPTLSESVALLLRQTAKVDGAAGYAPAIAGSKPAVLLLH